jgi:hypothetical protein
MFLSVESGVGCEGKEIQKWGWEFFYEIFHLKKVFLLYRVFSHIQLCRLLRSIISVHYCKKVKAPVFYYPKNFQDNIYTRLYMYLSAGAGETRRAGDDRKYDFI